MTVQRPVTVVSKPATTVIQDAANVEYRSDRNYDASPTLFAIAAGRVNRAGL